MTITELPHELLIKIFEYLSAKSLGKLSQVSDCFKEVTKEENLWKKKFERLGIDETEKKLIERNGGYKQAYYKMRDLIINKFEPALYDQQNDPTGIKSLLYIISYTFISLSRKGATFFVKQPSKDDLLTITKSNSFAFNFLMKRAFLLDYSLLAKLAAQNLNYTNTILKDYSKVVIEVINTNGEDTAWNLSYFFTEIEDQAGDSPQYRQFIDDFNRSDTCLQLYSVNNLSFDHVVS
ncbi:F-box-like [Legionella quinlivanii DSM 21216]|uniref:F-box protein n=1 Tax=Legionella quinlivanii TaxID=45073 RepID=UPI00089EFEE4|nr:F-box protein [Legionella quinlivanii]SEG40415.1 F-box-like [Legionella quinlivanii DSM 21216]